VKHLFGDAESLLLESEAPPRKRPYRFAKEGTASLDDKRPSTEGKTASLDDKRPSAEGETASLDDKRASAEVKRHL
jgi:hypothetical protein